MDLSEKLCKVEIGESSNSVPGKVFCDSLSGVCQRLSRRGGKQLEFGPLAGRLVALWPDNDNAVRKAMADTAGKLNDLELFQHL